MALCGVVRKPRVALSIRPTIDRGAVVERKPKALESPALRRAVTF